MSNGVLVITAEQAAQLAVLPREHLCTRRSMCLIREGHDGPCFEVAKLPYLAPELGPPRKKP